LLYRSVAQAEPYHRLANVLRAGPPLRDLRLWGATAPQLAFFQDRSRAGALLLPGALDGSRNPSLNSVLRSGHAPIRLYPDAQECRSLHLGARSSFFAAKGDGSWFLRPAFARAKADVLPVRPPIGMVVNIRMGLSSDGRGAGSSDEGW
jgi:hypothetical protein